MKTAYEIASQARQTLRQGAARPSNNSKNEPASQQRQRFIAQIFVRLQSNYGHRWSSLFKNDIDNHMLNAAKAEWRFDLRGYSEHEIKSAFQVMKKHYPNSPPTLPQFKRLCNEIRRRRSTAQSSQALLSRQAPRLASERVKQHIASMRRAIAGTSKQQPVTRERK